MEKPTLVFIHGLGGNNTVWSSYKPLFPQALYPSLSGNSSDEYVKNLAGLPFEKGVVFGNCFGAMIALRFAETYPERVQGLILMAPFFKETAARQRFWKYSTAGLRYVAAAKDRLGLTRRRRPFVDYGKYQHWPFYLHPFLDLRHMQFRRYVEDLYDAATFSPKKPNVPVLILVSREDPLIDIPRLSRAVSSWDAKIVFFPPTGEVAHLVREKQRNFIVKQINDWHALHHYSG